MKQLDLFTGEDSKDEDKPRLVIPNFETPEDLESFLAKLNVVEVGLFYLGDKIQKRPISHNYRGLCPFHNEKTPSFYLKPNKNIFVCYGCHISGGPLTLDYELGERIYTSIAQKANIDHFLPSLSKSYLLSVSHDISDNQKKYIQVLTEAFKKEKHYL